MAPKEEAKELVNKFVSLDNDIFCSVNYPYSKQCALIAVDEILDLIDTIYDYDRESLNPYWQEVKQEIEKL